MRLTLPIALFALLGAGLAVPATRPAGADGAWSPVGPPTPRGGHAAIYDPLRDRMLILGPLDFQPWMLSLAGARSWSSPVTSGTAPTGTAVMVYDSTRDRLILVGGATAGGTVWTLPLAGSPVWSALPISGPGPPPGCSAIYDPVRDRLLAFGGVVANQAFNEVYELPLAGDPQWNLLVTGGPAGRSGASVILDPVRDRMVIFGGYNPQPRLAAAAKPSGAALLGTRFNDVWALPLSGTPEWSQLSPTGAPPTPRTGQAAVYDPVRDQLVMFGGVPGSPPDPEVWGLSLGASPAWGVLAPAGLAGRYGHSAVYDAVRQRMLVFGGTDGSSIHNDTWAFDLGSNGWTILDDPAPLPPPRSQSAAAYDIPRRRMVVFGGSRAAGEYLADTWLLSLSATPSWTALSVLSTDPSPRGGHSAIYDPLLQRMILFGGYGGAYFSDTWALSLSGAPAWSSYTAVGAPPPRAGHAAIYDPPGNRMVIFGGAGPAGLSNEVWTLSLSTGIWSELHPAGIQPDPRMGASAVYDPLRESMMVFGGFGAGAFPQLRNDVWELTLSDAPRWIRLEPAGSPPAPRTQHVAIYDRERDRMIVFGGDAGGEVNDLWALSFSTDLAWTPLAATGVTPPSRAEHVAVFDPINQCLVTFSGDGPGALQDTWMLAWDATVAVPATRRSTLQVGSPAPNPARAGVRIDFTLPYPARASVDVLDPRGRRVCRLLDAGLSAGEHSVRWAGADTRGAPAPAGIYFCRITVGGESAVRRLALVR